MNTPPPSTVTVDPSSVLTLCQWKALRALKAAEDAARLGGQDVWQFAVEIGQLRRMGLNHTDLRLLLCWGYLAHARERTKLSAGRRTFQGLSNLTLPRRTCFVLTSKGLALASEHSAEMAPSASPAEEEQSEAVHPLPQVPHWDSRSRRLWWRDCLIKQFRVPAINQEVVLAALEEEGWPSQIDDPLPQTRDIDPKVRLHDTIKALNRHHQHQIIHFCGDGSGRAIRWAITRWSEKTSSNFPSVPSKPNS